MPNTDNRGGSHEQNMKTGQQGHKADDARHAPMSTDANTRGGTHEQHVKAGQQSHKNDR